MANDMGNFDSVAAPMVPGNTPRIPGEAELPRPAPRPTPPTNFDSIFELYRGSIPVEYLRALAIVSGGGEFKPSQTDGETAGLFKVSTNMIAAYSQALGKTLTPADLIDVATNTRIAVWLLNNVMKYYSLKYPKTLAVNWKNSDYVAILTLGFKVGHSENGGIGDALKMIEALQPDPQLKMTIDTVKDVLQERGSAAYLYAPGWIAFAKSVANLYAGSPHPESATAKGTPVVTSSGKKGFGVGGVVALAAIPIFALLFGKKP